MSNTTQNTNYLCQQSSLTISKHEVDQVLHSIQFPNACYWGKDKKSRYFYCNENHAGIAGLDSPQQMIGKNDYDFSWNNRAEFYQYTDKLVRIGHLLYLNKVEQVKTAATEINMLVTKYRVIDDNAQGIGVIGLNIDISDYYLLKKSGHYDEKKQIFYLDGDCKEKYLTKREMGILRLLMLGYTSKKIGKLLNISFRTVEGYINTFRYKLNCTSKNDITSAAIKLGLVFLILELPGAEH